MKKIILFMMVIFLICGCGNKMDINEKKIDIDVVLKEDNYIIVDVRSEEEYNTGHVIGSINIPYDLIDNSTLLDKEKTIIVYCKSGRRSNIAYNILKKLGYDVIDLGAYDSISLDKE